MREKKLTEWAQLLNKFAGKAYGENERKTIECA